MAGGRVGSGPRRRTRLFRCGRGAPRSLGRHHRLTTSPYSSETYRGAGQVIGYIVTLPVRSRHSSMLSGSSAASASSLLVVAGRRARAGRMRWCWHGSRLRFSRSPSTAPRPAPILRPGPTCAGSRGCRRAGARVAQRNRRPGRGGRGRCRPAACRGRVARRSEPTPAWRLRLVGLPQLASNAAFDLRYATGGCPARTISRGSRGDAGKFSPRRSSGWPRYVRDNNRGRRADLWCLGLRPAAST